MTSVLKHGEIDAAAKMIADWRSMMIVHAIYEHGPSRYKDIESMLELSPTVLSGKLMQLVDAGIIHRHQIAGAKEVTYEALPVAKHMVEAYHILEKVSGEIRSA